MQVNVRQLQSVIFFYCYSLLIDVDIFALFECEGKWHTIQSIIDFVATQIAKILVSTDTKWILKYAFPRNI